ncbi:MAG: glycerophosphodiester phosphodiesterase family protein [Acutalibacteraceae bacterium]|nr:glycerophosphodiester phosphodiesterase family protein [Acutalibacteraceae bacterium]
MAAIFVTIKNIFHGVVSVFMLIPILLTMGNSGNPDTPVITYPESDNPYISEYLSPDIAAHRSGAGVAPQNTLMAFENIVENEETLGVDTLEFDVQVTKDGELVLLHDLTLDGTSDAAETLGKKNVSVSSLTLEEAKVLNMGENFKRDGEYPYRGLRGENIPDNLRIVTCDEVIDYVEANSTKEYNYVIEIKSIGSNGRKAADKLYSVIAQRNLQGRVIWSTFDPFTSMYMKSNYPEISRTADAIEAIQFYFYFRMNWNLQDVSPSYVALQIPYGSSAFDNIINLGTREMLNYAHSNNIAVQYWTINSEDEVRTLTLNGADCIMTDYPQMAYDTVESCK